MNMAPCLRVAAQEENPTFIGINAHRGFILPHSKELRPISNTPVTALQIDIGRYNGGANAYQQCNCMYNSGISLQIADFGNHKELGQSIAFSGFMEPYLLKQSNWQMSFRYGIGLNYLNRVYHTEKNPRNIFYSSPVSFITYLSLNSTFKLRPKTNLVAAFFYNHISNGGMRMPNKGMNFPTLSLGMEFMQFPRSFSYTSDFKTDADFQPWLFYLQPAFSAKTYSTSAVKQGQLLPVFSIQAGGLYRLGKLSTLGMGVEYMDDRFQRQTLAEYQLSLPHQQVGILATHAFTFGRWILAQQYALYAYNRDPAARKAYQRYQLLYRFTDKWYIGGSLKTHRHVADVFDLRLMWHFQAHK